MIVRSTSYDAAGRPVRVDQPSAKGTTGNAGSRVTSYYDNAQGGTPASGSTCGDHPEWGGLVCQITPGGPISGARTSDPQTLPTTVTSDYTHLGQAKTSTQSSGGLTRTTVTRYDAGERPVGVKISGSASLGATQATVMVYDPDTGRQVATRSVDPANFDSASPTVLSELRWHFDALGRQDSYTDASGASTVTGYDIDDRPISVTDPSAAGASSTVYDQAGDAVQVTDPVAGSVTNSYDAGGNLVGASYAGTGVQLSQTIDPTGSVTGRSYTKSGLSGELLVDVVRENVHGQVVWHDGVADQSFGYDRAGRLVTVVDSFTTATGAKLCRARHYGFDANSNRIGLTEATGTADAGCPGVPPRPAASVGYDSADRLIADGYSYDAFGRTLTSPAQTRGGVSGAGSPAAAYTYNLDDRIASISTGGTGQTYSYDPARRVDTTSTTGGTSAGSSRDHYGDDGDSPAWTEVRDTSGNLSATSRYVSTADGSLITTTGSGISLGLVNIHGDQAISLPVNTGGPATVFDTDEYGVNDKAGLSLDPNTGQTTATGTTAAQPRYGWLGGKQRAADTPTVATLMGARVYVSTIGRFLQVDAVYGGSASAYDYCKADAINCYDLDGNWPHIKWKKIFRHARHATGWVARKAWGGVKTVGRCAYYFVSACADNIKLMMTPIILTGLSSVAFWGGVSACAAMLVGCVAGAPLIFMGGMGMYGAYRTSRTVWWGRGARSRYHHLG